MGDLILDCGKNLLRIVGVEVEVSRARLPVVLSIGPLQGPVNDWWCHYSVWKGGGNLVYMSTSISEQTLSLTYFEHSLTGSSSDSG
jgi:hypothetical protein